MTQIPLIHPIYLDVPMLFSFAAAIYDGLSFGADVTRESESKESRGGSVAGRMGVSKFLSGLFEASVSADASVKQSGTSVEVYREFKAHSEASIAIILYDHLRRQKGYLIVPSDPAELLKLETGSLVEMKGVIKKNAVDAMFDMIDAVSIFSALSTQQQQQQQQQQKKKDEGPKRQAERLLDALGKDRKRTPISNVLLRCSQPHDLTAVVTLRTANLRDLTLSELHKNTVRVVGKVTRSIEEGEVMSAFENSGFSLVRPEKLRELLGSLRTGELIPEFSDIEVKGPAVQVLPLMIFV